MFATGFQVKFGSFKVSEAEGATLAHAVRIEAGVLKKGRVLSTIDVSHLHDAGITEVIAAKLDVNDIPEDVAAHEIAVAACGSHAISHPAFTGRANLYSDVSGLLIIDEMRVRAINHLHESLTLATLPNFSRVEAHRMLATVKIIPFAVPRDVRDAALKIITDEPLVKVVPFKALRVGLVITKLPQTKETLIAKSESAIRDRVLALGGMLASVTVCDHTQNAVCHALEKVSADIILVFGASAIVDRADVIPAALIDAGGEVLHVGMPVDPGNLLTLGRLKTIPVVGVPSCARSPKLNGFDWVLARLMAGLDVTPHDIMDLGIGGLLAEIPSRPSPRDPQVSSSSAPRVAALVLAAGSSTRMESNKLLADIQGQPMIARTVQRIAQSSVEKIMVITGHQADEVSSALLGQDVELVHNTNFTQGLSTSLRLGVSKLQESYDAILVCLGDMPLIDARVINLMIAALDTTEHRSIVVPVHGSKFGNPVLWGASHFTALMTCEGDRGARGLLESLREDVLEIAVDHEGVVLDADTPEALALIRSIASTEN